MPNKYGWQRLFIATKISGMFAGAYWGGWCILAIL